MVSARDCALPGFTGREEDGDADRGERHRGEAGGCGKTEEQSCQIITASSTKGEA